jgi:hypothetical protein
MLRHKPSEMNKPRHRRRRKAANPAKRTKAARRQLEDGDDDLFDHPISDEDVDDMLEDPDPWEAGFELEEEEDEDVDERLRRRRRRIRDDEVRWQEEALADWREMESFRREYNDY